MHHGGILVNMMKTTTLFSFSLRLISLGFNFQEMVKEKKLIFQFDPTRKARFGVLPRYAKNELLIKWFELPNCFIFHNGEHV